MVLINEDNVPVSNWPLGRVVKLYLGKDIIRVVDIKTKTGIFKRSVSRLCVLPIERSRCSLLLSLSEYLLPSDDLPETLFHDVGESEHGDSQPAAKKSTHVTEDFAALRK
ncbi:hypothetical protein AVEN_78471-1 [Araneus ventricosus]|uniref:DUF5641 domain-containing protein n=1 Tax=Araneus ventricosus TaxID=182803 RepID=A0A4Y2LWJ2_ARAVE|nr:hypothetical protein AVEN_78471-1 [Araneus ventricosus]